MDEPNPREWQLNEHPGHPLEGAGMVISGKNKLVKDDPFAKAKDIGRLYFDRGERIGTAARIGSLPKQKIR